MESNAVVTTNGAGPHNVQLFVLSEDGTVLHCLPGYWNPEDLASELELAQRLNDVWLNKSITTDQKAAIFKKMQLEHLASHSKETSERSHLQGFDAQYVAQLPELIEKPELLREYQCHAQGKSKGAKEGEGMHVPCEAFKTTDQIMHERLSKTPFVAYQDFDIASFTNYGIDYYDKNENEAEGSVFRPELKKLDLHKVTHDASAAPLSTGSSGGTIIAAATSGAAACGATSAACAKNAPIAAGAKAVAGADKSADPLRNFLELTAAKKFNAAYACASGLIKAKPNSSLGYEMRALSAYALAQYEKAYADATRAAWLGCRDASNAELRKLAKQRIDRQTAQKPLRIAQK